MWSALNFLTSRAARTSGRNNRRRLAERRPAGRRLQLEALEDRRLLTSYVVTDLGALPVGSYSTPADINAAGQVVGSADTPDNTRAVLWNNGTIIELGTLQLGGLNGTSQATAINDLGQIVGWSSVKANLVYPYLESHAFLITPEDTDGDGAPDRWFRDLDADGVNDLMTDLGVPADAIYNHGVGINNAGQVVVVGNDKAFVWDSGVFIEVDALGGGGGNALGINDAGQVVGYARDATGQTHAFVWDSSRGKTDVTPTSYTAEAYAINSSGSVVGWEWDGGVANAFAWTPNEPNGTVGIITVLDPLPYHDHSKAEDINDAGLVVGASEAVTTYCEDDGFGLVCADYYTTRPVVWEDGVAIDLQNQVLGDLGITLESANAINAAGQIVGEGSLPSGLTHAVLLTPVGGPTVSIGDATAVEGNTGTVGAVFTITLSEASTQPVSVTIATADGTATAGNDYVAASDTLTFAPGETSKTVPVLVNGDTLYEPDESFFLNLTSPINAVIADGSARGTIHNDDPIPPALVISNASVTEGHTGTVSATFTVSLSAAYGQPVTVHYETAGGSAAAGSDYMTASGDVTIAAGETSQTFPVVVLGDRTAEPTENFVVNLTAVTNAFIVDSQGLGTIVDDEPRISIGDVSKSEGQRRQTTLFTFTVSLSAVYDQPVTMSYRTVNGTATSGDYVAKTGTLTFAPGETTKTIVIEVKGDNKKEANETFYLDLFGNSSNSLFTKSRGIGTILNDD